MATADIKISQAVWDKNMEFAGELPAGSERLGTILDELAKTSAQLAAVAPDGSQWSRSGDKVVLKSADAQTVTYTGVVNSGDDSSGTAVATSKVHVIPMILSETIKGAMNFAYKVSGGQLLLDAQGAGISYYNLRTLSAPLDPDFGRQSWELTGNVDANADGTLSGKLKTISVTADKYLKSFKLGGDLNIVRSSAMGGIHVEGEIRSMSTEYADKSYARVAGPIGYHDAMIADFQMFADPAPWSGDDSFKFDLPAKLGTDLVIHAGEGNDAITAKGGGGYLSLFGDAGNDRFILGDALSKVNGGSGIDTIETGISLSLDGTVSVENLTLTGKAHVNATGNLLDNLITGNAGKNVLDGAGGDDTLKGGGGNDTYQSDFSGNVTIDDASGKDLLVLNGILRCGLWEGSTLWLSGTGFKDSGSITTNVIILNANKAGAIESIRFGEGMDSYQVATSQTGGKANDLVIGTAFDDVLRGMDGNDCLYGSEGIDVLVGGKGKDLLTGGAEADIFRFERVTDSVVGAEDVLLDFSAGIDKIDLTLLDANVKLQGTQAFAYSETGPAANALWSTALDNGVASILYGDVNGDAQADFAIELTGIATRGDILGIM